jgi:hypothetical protein
MCIIHKVYILMPIYLIDMYKVYSDRLLETYSKVCLIRSLRGLMCFLKLLIFQNHQVLLYYIWSKIHFKISDLYEEFFCYEHTLKIDKAKQTNSLFQFQKTFHFFIFSFLYETQDLHAHKIPL